MHCIASEQVLLEHAVCPLAEAGADLALDAVTYGDDDIKVVILDLACDLALAFHSNCFQNGNSWIALQFAFIVYVLDVLADGWHLDVEELRHLLLREPNTFVM